MRPRNISYYALVVLIVVANIIFIVKSISQKNHNLHLKYNELKVSFIILMFCSNHMQKIYEETKVIVDKGFPNLTQENFELSSQVLPLKV